MVIIKKKPSYNASEAIDMHLAMATLSYQGLIDDDDMDALQRVVSGNGCDKDYIVLNGYGIYFEEG